MKEIIIISILFIIVSFSGCASAKDNITSPVAVTLTESIRPAKDFVPDEETAIRIAEAVWIPIYGKEAIERHKPFKATLGVFDVWHTLGKENGIDAWHVRGTLPEGTLGGTAEVIISKKDGRIIRVFHSQ